MTIGNTAALLQPVAGRLAISAPIDRSPSRPTLPLIPALSPPVVAAKGPNLN